MRDRERKKRSGGGESVRESRGNRETAESRKREKNKCENEKMIRFMRSEATKFVAALKNPSLLHLMGTRHGL